MLELLINDSYYDKIETIKKRAATSLDIDMLIRVLLFGQYFKFLKSPKSYTQNIYEKRRIKKDTNSTMVKCPEDFFQYVDKEIKKAQGDLRYGTGREEISISKVLTEKVLNKMLYEEINSLYDSTKKGNKRYNKCNFRKIESLLIDITNSKDFFSKDCFSKNCFSDGCSKKDCFSNDCFTNLEQVLKEYNINKKHFIYYMMLSVQVPESTSIEEMLSEEFVRAVISQKIEALKQSIIEAQEGLKRRETKDIILQYTYPDLLSYQIRQMWAENPQPLEDLNFKSVAELKETIRTEYKNEKEYY